VIEWRLGDSPYHSTANDLFALLIKVKMKCTGKLRYSDVDSNKPNKHKLETTERERAAE